MATEQQIAALTVEYAAAKAAGHIFPDYAACEAMEESAWGTTQCYLKCNNPFGQKQQAPPIKYAGLNLPTWEVVRGKVTHIVACFVQFPDRATAYVERMATLERLRTEFPEYEAALNATTGEEFVTEVSARWSTDPNRATNVLAIHTAHKDVFA